MTSDFKKPQIVAYFMKNCNQFFMRTRRFRSVFCWLAGTVLSFCGIHSRASDAPLIALGAEIFRDARLSSDGKVSCQSCHNPAHAFTDSRPRGVGVYGKVGTRNVPSLIGVGEDRYFLWDGRRTRLADVVIDPFTNPVEMGLGSTTDLLVRLRRDSSLTRKFEVAFPHTQRPTLDQVRASLAAFVRSLSYGRSAYSLAESAHTPLPKEAEFGRDLFVGTAGCAECHAVDHHPATFTDQAFHHSGVAQEQGMENLPEVAQSIVTQSRDVADLGPILLSDPNWSALGRFVVTHRPADIGAFRTPSLRNVAVTAPYMHDGSIATLSEAVDQEIYYRGFSTGRAINLSAEERQAIVAFLACLTDR